MASQNGAHPNNLVNSMWAAGYEMSDMLPAFPGQTEAYLDEVLRDNAFALSRPVIPYGLLGIHERSTKFFNVHSAGFRKQHAKSNEPWPPAKDHFNIFFFGGSTTLGTNLEDKDSTPAVLQELLNAQGYNCTVYNFAAGNYTSRHELLRFLSILDEGLDEGIIPDLALFLDGYNESHYAFGNKELINALDNLYQTEKTRRRQSFFKAVFSYAKAQFNYRFSPLPSTESYLPANIPDEVKDFFSDASIARCLEASTQRFSKDTLSFSQNYIGKKVWEFYQTSVELIQTLAQRAGIPCLHFWQPVAYFATAPEQRLMEKLFYTYRYSASASAVYHWLHAEDFPQLSQKPYFFNLAELGEKETNVLYTDLCHYSPYFSAKIAEAVFAKITPFIKSKT